MYKFNRSALKICYSSLTKSFVAIGIQACLTAKSFELDEVVFNELKTGMSFMLHLVNKVLSHVLPKAARWLMSERCSRNH